MPNPALVGLVSIAPRIADIAGITVFAATGAMAAARKHHDIVAACFFALITATGGGTLRDLLLGVPVFWMVDWSPTFVCIVVGIVVWLMPVRLWPSATMEWFDGVGLAAYAVYGSAKALAYGTQPLQALAMGVVTATMGGVIRDVVAGERSMLLRNELYVTAAILASAVFICLRLLHAPIEICIAAGFVAGFALRGAAICYGLKLPQHP